MNMSLEKSNASLRGLINDLSYAQEVFDEYNATTSKFQWVKTMDDSTVTYNNELVKVIEELEKKMPSQIRILSLTASESSLNLSITVENKEAVADVIMQLRTFDSIALSSVSAISESANEDGTTLVSFSVACTYLEQSVVDEEGNGTISDLASEVGESTNQATAELENVE